MSYAFPVCGACVLGPRQLLQAHTQACLPVFTAQETFTYTEMLGPLFLVESHVCGGTLGLT